MSKSKEEVPYIYMFIHFKLKEKFPYNFYLKPKEILEILKRVCRIPKTLNYPVLHQMESWGLINRINHQKYKLSSESYEETLEKLRNREFWD